MSPIPPFLLLSPSPVLKITPLCTLFSFRGSWTFSSHRLNLSPNKQASPSFLLSTQPSLRLLSLGEEQGERKGKGSRPRPALASKKGFGHFRHKGLAWWAELGVAVLTLWPNSWKQPLPHHHRSLPSHVQCPGELEQACWCLGKTSQCAQPLMPISGEIQEATTGDGVSRH